MTDDVTEVLPGQEEIPGTDDTEAPYGRRADGTPRRRPGPPPGSGGRPRKNPAMAAPAPRRKTNAPKRPGGVDYRPGILGMVQVATFPLAVAGAHGNPTLALDAAAVALHAPALAEALNALAHERPEVAAVLDRIMSVGPYGALIGALVPIVVQIAANHRVIPAGTAESLGALKPEDLVKKLESDASR